ncbi:MAG TPA: NAD(P)-dependent oxidoreductase [Solirubrobacteraceae bacterium]|jgi:UDP-glucose 4-epimerase|nr:NAD(P)-dependent oxidoreductase [Solirubrobacteraceae bacterium]
MTRVLVAGGGGFIGSHLVRTLVDHGAAVTVADAWCSYGAPEDEERRRTLAWRREQLLDGAHVHTLSTDDARALRQLIRDCDPHVVVQLANLPFAQQAFEQPHEARHAILGSTDTLLAALQHQHAPHLHHVVYVSSSMVYGDFHREPMPEHAPCKPLEPYGRYKHQSEGLVREHGHATGRTVTIVRPSAVYGPGDLGGRFVQRLVAAAQSRATLTLTGGGRTRLDFTFVEDLAHGLRLAVLQPPGANSATLNMTYGQARSLTDAVHVVRQLGYPVDIDFADEHVAFRPRRGALDNSRARQLLGYAPQHPLELGLQRYLAATAPVAA